MAKPSLPQGTRDFSAAVVRKRNYILSTIRTVFENYGFQPLETPAMENLDTLMGKYGEEGDKLIFRILNSGNPFPKGFFTGLQDYVKLLNEDVRFFDQHSDSNAKTKLEVPFWEINPTVLEVLSKELLENANTSEYLSKFKNETSAKALRYDLTIPFARYVAMNFGQLTLPYKRYQIQPVWRADRPQRGRYREFYQCDADVVGSKSLLNEAELTCLYADVFAKLNIDVQIRLNSRKILAALAEICGGSDKLADITVAIDKLDKIGIEKVKEELAQRGLRTNQISIIEQYLLIDGSNEERLQQVKGLLQSNETGKEGIEELEHVISFLPSTINQRLITDFTLARGLSYYTGIIFEVKANDIQMGSIGGGGRYDDLTGLFGVPDVPGVGISFGVDRIYDVMEEKKLFPDTLLTGTQVLFFNLGEAESKAAFHLMQSLRSQNIACEMYGEASKFDKQFRYAEKKNIPFIVIIGSEELQSHACKIKDLRTGIQQTIAQADLLNYDFSQDH